MLLGKELLRPKPANSEATPAAAPVPAEGE
jgi:hypothetical protein